MNSQEKGIIPPPEIAELIWRDPHVVVFIPGKEEKELRETAQRVNLGTIQESIEHLIDYLEGPIIVDDFREDRDRDAWEKENGLRFHQFYIKNKLRASRMTIPLGLIDILKRRFIPDIPEKFWEEQKRIRSIFGTFTEPESYDFLSPQNKIRVVRDLDNLVRHVVQFVCQREGSNL